MRMPGSLGWTSVLDLCDPLYLHYIPATCNNSKDQTYFFLLFLFFFLFFLLRDSMGHLHEVFTPTICPRHLKEVFTQGPLIQILYFLRDSRGASMRFSPLLPAQSASERFSSKDLFIFLFLFFDDQGVAGTEAEPFPITSTDFFTVSMNSYLERGFL